MKKMISKGLYVLCYDKNMKLVLEMGPILSEKRAFRLMEIEVKSGEYHHVEVSEKVIIGIK